MLARALKFLVLGAIEAAIFIFIWIEFGWIALLLSIPIIALLSIVGMRLKEDRKRRSALN